NKHQTGGPTFFGIWAIQTKNLTVAGVIMRNWQFEGISVSLGNVANTGCLVDTTGRNGMHVGYATSTTISGCRVHNCPDITGAFTPDGANGLDIEVEGIGGTIQVTGITIQDRKSTRL